MGVSFRRKNLACMHAELSFFPVGEEVAQRGGYGAKGDFLPGNLALAEKRHLQSLRPGRKGPVEKPCAVEDMHLVDVRNRQKGEYLAQLDARLCLLHRFPQRGLRGGLAELHEPRGERPQPVAWLDRTSAKENAVLPFRNRADYHQRVAVMDGAATVADVAR